MTVYWTGATDKEKKFMKEFRDEFISSVNADDPGVHYVRDIRSKLVSCAVDHANLELAAAGQFDIDPFPVYVEYHYGIKLHYTEDGNFLPEYDITDEQKYLIFMMKF